MSVHETTHSCNRKILVIDDNPNIHEDFRKILTGNDTAGDLAAVEAALFGNANQDSEKNVVSQDFHVECANQGEAGLALLKKAVQAGQPFALAFVDMRMPPGWDGLATIEELWKVDPDLQIVICTAYSDCEWSEMSRRLGNSEKWLLLRKPFAPIEVQQLADSLTHKWNLAASTRQYVESLVHTEQALQCALAETESLIAAISSILIGIDEHDCVIRFNAPAERILGISSDRVIGYPLQSIGIHWDWNVVREAIRDCRQQQHSIRIHEVSYRNVSGAERILGMTVSPIAREGKAFPGALILAKDITQQRHLDAQRMMAQKMESIGRLAAGVAHEINTPVHYVSENVRFLKESFHDVRRLLDAYGNIGHPEQLANSKDSAIDVVTQITKEIDLEYLLDEIPTVLTQCQEGTDRVADIVRAMNEFSHPGEGERLMVDLNHSLQDALKLSTTEWKDVADVVTDFSPDLPPVPGLPTELSQVWINVLVNAAQAIQELKAKGVSDKGVISVKTRLDGEWAEVCVSDTGSGIDESIRAHVFDLFFTTKDVGTGTGQGLALAHSIIVQRHGGVLTFDPRPSGGTTFIIRLPIQPLPVGREVLHV